MTSTLTPIQVRAARAYLEWSQEQASVAANISLSTLRGFENGVLPRTSTMRQIREAFEKVGVEFTEDEGVKWQQRGVKVYQGRESSDKFFDDVTLELKERGGDFLALIKSKDMLIKSCGLTNHTNLQRMEQLHKPSHTKCLIAESLYTSSLMPSFPIRMVPDQIDGPTCFYVYGHKYAIANIDERGYAFFGVFNLEFFAQAYRAHFMSRWDNALLPMQESPTGRRVRT